MYDNEKYFSYRSVVLQMEKRECFDNRLVFTLLVRLFISPVVVQSTGKKNELFKKMNMLVQIPEQLSGVGR